MTSTASDPQTELKKRYLHIAIEEYEYSFAPEYEKKHMSRKATKEGTIDFDSDSAVEISIDGAWVSARVWVPKAWIDSK